MKAFFSFSTETVIFTHERRGDTKEGLRESLDVHESPTPEIAAIFALSHSPWLLLLSPEVDKRIQMHPGFDELFAVGGLRFSSSSELSIVKHKKKPRRSLCGPIFGNELF